MQCLPAERAAHAEVAELLPGEAIHIPPIWWHRVASLQQIHALVYWWIPGIDGGRATPGGLARPARP